MKCLKCGREFWSAESRYCNSCVFNRETKGMTKVTEDIITKVWELVNMQEEAEYYARCQTANELGEMLTAMTAAQDSGEPRLNIKHEDCHKAADAFWKYWEENGETHRHGYYESTWGAINAAIALVGVTEWESPSSVQVDREDLKFILDKGTDVNRLHADDCEKLLEIETRFETILSTEDTQ